MLSSAKAFGHPQGWPCEEHFPDGERQRLLEVLMADVRDEVRLVLQAGRRIPEEVLGPDELRSGWSHQVVDRST
jgi:hypothetical protein